MAKKTNKTDHVLNLLSSGSKKKGNDHNAKDKPPVQLKRKGEEAPDPEIVETAEEKAIEQETAEQTPAVESAPKVSVVQAEGDQNPIADAVKDSLEAELDAYLKEEAETGNAKPLIETEEDAAKEEEDLPDHGTSITEDFPDLDDLPDGGKWDPKEGLSDLTEETVQDGEQTEALPDLPDAEPEPELETKRQSGGEQMMSDAAIQELLQQQAAEEAAAGSGAETDAAAESDAEPVSEPEPEPEAEPQMQAEHQVLSDAEMQALVKQESAAGKVEAAAAEAAPEPTAEPEEPEQDFVMVNVMERLVRLQAEKYIHQFGHCDCERCVEDTVALALSHLPPKYVVVNPAAVSPLINFYEKQYAGQLLVEITKASMIVNETPHH